MVDGERCGVQARHPLISLSKMFHMVQTVEALTFDDIAKEADAITISGTASVAATSRVCG
jgi:hypothetical protein